MTIIVVGLCVGEAGISHASSHPPSPQPSRGHNGREGESSSSEQSESFTLNFHIDLKMLHNFKRTRPTDHSELAMGHMLFSHQHNQLMDKEELGKVEVIKEKLKGGHLNPFRVKIHLSIDENANADVTALYNILDELCHELGCAFVVVHHLSKGMQEGKRVTDLGSGAGAQSRAVDTHIALREHAEPGCVVLEAVTRSWPRPEARVLRWADQGWALAEGLDPGDLAGRKKKKSEAPEAVTPERLAAACLDAAPVSKAEVILRARERLGTSSAQATRMLAAAVDRGLAKRWQAGAIARRSRCDDEVVARARVKGSIASSLSPEGHVRGA